MGNIFPLERDKCNCKQLGFHPKKKKKNCKQLGHVFFVRKKRNSCRVTKLNIIKGFFFFPFLFSEWILLKRSLSKLCPHSFISSVRPNRLLLLLIKVYFLQNFRQLQWKIDKRTATITVFFLCKFLLVFFQVVDPLALSNQNYFTSMVNFFWFDWASDSSTNKVQNSDLLFKVLSL